MITFSRAARAALLPSVLVLSAVSAAAQEYPVKAIRFIAPNLPAGPTDILARLLGQKLSEAFGQPVVIENRAGAGGIVAAEVVARAAPDGYAFLAATPNIPVVRVAAESKMSFDPTRDLVPLTAVASTPSIFIVHPSVPVNSYRELMDYARKYPDKLSYGTSGVGSAHHLAAEQIRMLTAAVQLGVASREKERQEMAAAGDRKSTRLNSSHVALSRMPSSA